MLRNEITIYLKDKNTKLFFELISQNYEVSLPLLFKKIPRKTLYRIREYVKEYEEVKSVQLIKEKAGISSNGHFMKILQSNFPIDIVKNIALVDVSQAEMST